MKTIYVLTLLAAISAHTVAQDTDVKVQLGQTPSVVRSPTTPTTITTTATTSTPSDDAVTALTFYRVSSFIVDGGIRDVTSSNTDKTASGLIGYRRNNLFNRFDLSVVSISTLTAINSADTRDYSRTILNPYNTQSGPGIYFSFMQRYILKKTEILSRMEMLRQEGALSRAGYNQTISDDNSYEKYDDWKSFTPGYSIEFQVSNFSWTKNDITRDGTLIAFNPYLIKSLRYYDDITEDFIEAVIGFGPSFRTIRGDVTKEFMQDVLGNRVTSLSGWQSTFQLYFKNFYAKCYYSHYHLKNKIDGFTGGQFYLSIGITAEIGASKKKTESLADLVD